jgi:hypothetical protein
MTKFEINMSETKRSLKRDLNDESSRIKDECDAKLARLDDLEDRERQVSNREAEIVCNYLFINIYFTACSLISMQCVTQSNMRRL